MIIWNNLNIQNSGLASVNISTNNTGRATFTLDQIDFQSASSENVITIFNNSRDTYIKFPSGFNLGSPNRREFVSYQGGESTLPTAALLFRSHTGAYRYYGFDLYGDLNIATGNDDYCGRGHGGNLIVQGNSQINGNLIIDGTISKIELPDNDGSESEKNPNSWTAVGGLHSTWAKFTAKDSILSSDETTVEGVLNCDQDVVVDGSIRGANIGQVSIKPMLWIRRHTGVLAPDDICLLAQHDSTITSFGVKVNNTTVTDKHFNEVWEISIPNNGATIEIIINGAVIDRVTVGAKPSRDYDADSYFFELTPRQYFSNYMSDKATIIGKTSQFGAIFTYWSSLLDVDRISAWAWGKQQGFNHFKTSNHSGSIYNIDPVDSAYSGIVRFTTEQNT